MEKGQHKEFGSLWERQSGSESGKQNWILIWMLKGGTQKTRKSAFYAKREAALIDGGAHIGCQGRKMSEKSNSAFELEDKPIPARESFVAFR